MEVAEMADWSVTRMPTGSNSATIVSTHSRTRSSMEPRLLTVRWMVWMASRCAAGASAPELRRTLAKDGKRVQRPAQVVDDADQAHGCHARARRGTVQAAAVGWRH